MSYTNSFNNPVVRGVINPIKTVTHKKELHFDSRFRDNYGAPGTSASSFLYTLPSEIQDVVSLRLASIHVPNAILTVSQTTGNNTLIVNDVKITIPDDNYTVKELRAEITNAIAAIAPTLNVVFGPDDNTKPKTKITSDFPTVIKFYEQDNCTNFMSTLGWLLGFRVASVTVTSTNPVTSSGLYDNGFTDYLYFSVDDFQRNMSNNNTVYMNKTTSNNNILGKIYRSSLDGTYLLNNYNSSTSYKTDKHRIYYGPVRLSKFKFSLLDKFGNIVNINNMDYSFTLEVEVLYDRNNVTIPC